MILTRHAIVRVSDDHAEGAKTQAIIALHFVVSCAAVLAAYLMPSADLAESAAIRLECLILSGLAVWLIWSWRTLAGGFFNPYGLFLAAALLFNGGQAFLEVFGWNSQGLLAGTFSTNVLERTLVLVMLSLAVLHLGALIALAFTTPSAPRGAGTSGQGSAADAFALRLIGSLLLAISIVPTALVLRDALNVASFSGYAGLFSRDFATGLQAGPQVLASLLVPGSMFLLAGTKRTRGVLISGTVIGLYAAVMFYLGYRAPAVMAMVAWAWLYDRTVRRISPWVLLGGAAALMSVVFPLVRAVRDLNLADRAYFAAFLSTSNPFLSTLSEMGASMNTVAYTMTLVPSTRPYDLGIGYAYSALTVVPNLFWHVHPAVTHQYSTWLSTTVSPGSYFGFQGFGFSFIAEAFLNFGWLGPLAAGLIGFGIARLYLWADRSSRPARLALVASYLSFILVFARGESNLLVRPFFWYSLAPYLAVLILSQAVARTRAAKPTFPRTPLA